MLQRSTNKSLDRKFICAAIKTSLKIYVDDEKNEFYVHKFSNLLSIVENRGNFSNHRKYQSSTLITILSEKEQNWMFTMEKRVNGYANG